mmetsp:Transcript_1826/g.4251  ORF Transcript_1826/g.4251 Transcript_1826/m.4251 type:complete len:150 (+) Transcript_1826:142-591(+)
MGHSDVSASVQLPSLHGRYLLIGLMGLVATTVTYTAARSLPAAGSLLPPFPGLCKDRQALGIDESLLLAEPSEQLLLEEDTTPVKSVGMRHQNGHGGAGGKCDSSRKCLAKTRESRKRNFKPGTPTVVGFMGALMMLHSLPRMAMLISL